MADLSDVQAKAVLSIKARGTHITRAAYFDNYNLPRPIKVAVQLEGVAKLSAIMDDLMQSPIAAALPRRGLVEQLDECRDPQRPWSVVPAFIHAIEQLEPIVLIATEPLVFTNGDYQPANFLIQNNMLSGVDFEAAGFQDPMIGFAKYPIYDLHPLNKAGAVDAFRGVRGYSKQNFASRLALGCLMALQKEVSVVGGDEQECQYRAHILELLTHALSDAG